MRKVLVTLLMPVALATSIGCHSIEDLPDFCAQWRSADEQTRGSIARVLVENQTLVGWSKDRVRSCLGVPDEDGQSYWVYAIDTGASFQFENESYPVGSILEILFKGSLVKELAISL